MKTITMDWDTYQKEIDDKKDNYQKGYADGAKANQKRLDPILDVVREIINDKFEEELKSRLLFFMKNAGEL